MLRTVFIFLILFSCTFCGSSKLTSVIGEWKLQTLKGEDVSNLAKPVTLVFEGAESEAKAIGYAGCNRYFSSYTQEKFAIKFSDIGSTKMFCKETMDIEEKFLKALGEVSSFKMTDGKLQLFSGDLVVLIFTR
jgi:heat shock protein HslJ